MTKHAGMPLADTDTPLKLLKRDSVFKKPNG